MKESLFQSLSESLTQAVDIHQGKLKPTREIAVHEINTHARVGIEKSNILTPATKTINTTIHNVLEAKGLTPQQLSEIINVSEKTIRQWCSKKAMPNKTAQAAIDILKFVPKTKIKLLNQHATASKSSKHVDGSTIALR